MTYPSCDEWCRDVSTSLLAPHAWAALCVTPSFLVLCRLYSAGRGLLGLLASFCHLEEFRGLLHISVLGPWLRKSPEAVSWNHRASRLSRISPLPRRPLCRMVSSF